MAYADYGDVLPPEKWSSLKYGFGEGGLGHGENVVRPHSSRGSVRAGLEAAFDNRASASIVDTDGEEVVWL